jgi:DNA-binding XRE family transcriptional regulator
MRKANSAAVQVIQRFSPGFSLYNLCFLARSGRSVEKVAEERAEIRPLSTFCVFRSPARLLRLEKGRMTTEVFDEQSNEPLANYLRTHRLKSGFTQNDLAGVLGNVNRDMISRHERQEQRPSLLVALSYEIFYRIPVSEIFVGLAKTVESNVEAQLAEYQTYLGNQSATGTQAASIARKLEWLSERRSSGYK